MQHFSMKPERAALSSATPRNEEISPHENIYLSTGKMNLNWTEVL